MFFYKIKHYILKVFVSMLDNYPTCFKYDKKLNEMLDSEDFEISNTGYTIILNDCEIWISNYPYAYGCIHYSSSTKRSLPAMQTRIRIKKLVDKKRGNANSEKSSIPESWK